MERYLRQIIMPQIGEDGQKKLSESKVLVVGAGGLGSPVLYYLTVAGIGTIGVLDFDVVSVTNLNRQILHYEKDIDVLKVESAKEKLHGLNSKVKIVEHNIKLSEENIDEILKNYDIVVDCVDNIEARHLVNKHALKLGMHIIEAGIEGLCGFIMTVKPGEACYGCLNPNMKKAERKIPVLGATAGVAGSMEAVECIKVLLGIGEPLYSKALFYDLQNMSFNIIKIGRSNKCPDCGDAE